MKKLLIGCALAAVLAVIVSVRGRIAAAFNRILDSLVLIR